MKSKIFLFFTFGVFIFVSGGVLLDGFAETWNKVSVDDHYAWILKAPQMADCFGADCRFIKDTREQTKMDFKNFDRTINYELWRQQHCLFDIYTPLYTLQMILYKKAFNLSTWEEAYQAVSVTGYIVSVAGALVFLLTLFGPYPTGVAFLLMSLSEWGWRYSFGVITPSFFITGVFFWLLTFFLKKPQLFLKCLAPIIILISLYHPIGKVYSAGLLLLAGFCCFDKLLKERKTFLLFLLSGLSFIGTLAVGLIEQPQFKISEFPFNNTTEKVDQLVQNIKSLFSFFANYFYVRFDWVSNGIICIGLILVIFRLLKEASPKKPLQNIVGILLLVLSLVSVFHLLKNLPGELSRRAVVPLFIYLCGAIGFLSVHFILSKDAKRKTRLISGCVVLLFVAGIASHHSTPDTLFSTSNSQQFFDARNNLYDSSQVQKIFDQNGNCGSIFYLSQAPMWVYSTYGALKCGALVGFLLPFESKEFAQLLAERKDLTHAVASNPIYSNSGVPILYSYRMLMVKIKETAAQDFKIKLKTAAEPVKFEVIHVEGSGKVLDKKILEMDSNKEFTISTTVKAGERIALHTLEGEVLVEKASFSETLNWPWAEPVILSFLSLDVDQKVSGIVDVDLEKWQSDVSNHFKLNLKVIDDSKSTVLMTVGARS